MTPTCRHGDCRNPAPDYVLRGIRGQSWPVCSGCAESLAALGAWIVPTNHPGSRGAAEPDWGTGSPVGGPASVRTGATVR